MNNLRYGGAQNQKLTKEQKEKRAEAFLARYENINIPRWKKTDSDYEGKRGYLLEVLKEIAEHILGNHSHTTIEEDGSIKDRPHAEEAIKEMAPVEYASKLTPQKAAFNIGSAIGYGNYNPKGNPSAKR